MKIPTVWRAVRARMMRWEELWDTAMGIRAASLGCPVPGELTEAIARALDQYSAPEGWAVRSSAPGEDSQIASFAGLHESVLPVFGSIAMFDAIRTVWASLWSDAALLYRRQLGLDAAQSRDWVTVDGCLGIVTLGKAEFDLELGGRPRSATEAGLLP